MSRVPSIPTSRPSLDQSELEAVQSVFDGRWLGTGALTQKFEDEVAYITGARHVVAVNSGTAALHIALEALEIGADCSDEVLVPSLTFVATIQAIIACGARPVFCEIDPRTGQLDLADLRTRITRNTRAILVVHYGGACGDMDGLLELATDLGVPIVEDAAHAFGSSYKGRRVGTLGTVTCFSFDPIKNITCGGGGAAVTQDSDLAARLRTLSNVGLQEDSWDRLVVSNRGRLAVMGKGYRYRMLDLNAAIGLAQLTKLERFRTRKIAIVRRYDDAFRNHQWLRIFPRNWDETFPFHYAVRVMAGRQHGLTEHLAAAGIGTTIHFMPNHLHEAFAEFSVSLPATEQFHAEVLTLPLYVDMDDKDVSHVIAAVNSFFERATTDPAHE